MKASILIWIAAMCVMSAALVVPAQAQHRAASSGRAAEHPAVKSPDAITWGDLEKGQNSFTATQAAHRLEKAGYRHVKHLRLGSDGIWHADAKMKNRAVHVALDYRGNVAER